jgi:hypothetical protein
MFLLYVCAVLLFYCSWIITKIQQKHNPDTTEQRYNTKVQEKHNPDTIEQRYNTKIQQKHNTFVLYRCSVVSGLCFCCICVLYPCSVITTIQHKSITKA